MLDFGVIGALFILFSTAIDESSSVRRHRSETHGCGARACEPGQAPSRGLAGERAPGRVPDIRGSLRVSSARASFAGAVEDAVLSIALLQEIPNES